MVSISSHICMFSHQGVALFQKDREGGLVGRSVSLGVGFEILEAQVSPNVSFFLLPADPGKNSQLLLQEYVCHRLSWLPSLQAGLVSSA